VARPKIIRRVASRGYRAAVADSEVQKVLKRFKIPSSAAKLVIGSAVLAGAEAMWEELKKELPWD
jgi:hypothetical protein